MRPRGGWQGAGQVGSPAGRNGFVEETWSTCPYSPLLDADGGVVGLLNTVTGTTEQVLATRRLDLARQLARTAATRHPDLERAGAAVVDVPAWLVEQVAAHGGLPRERLCDHLLGAVAPHAEDDIALLALRAHPARAGRAA